MLRLCDVGCGFTQMHLTGMCIAVHTLQTCALLKSQSTQAGTLRSGSVVVPITVLLRDSETSASIESFAEKVNATATTRELFDGSSYEDKVGLFDCATMTILNVLLLTHATALHTGQLGLCVVPAV